MTDFLSLQELLDFADEAGIGPVRDLGLLDSAAARPRTSLFGDDAYPSIEEKAAVLLESIVRNLPLGDGNKRLGWIAAKAFLRINDIRLQAPHDEAYDLVIAVATGTLPYEESARVLAGWID